MVKFLPRTATRPITITVKEVATILTISAPSSAEQGASFLISGQLRRADTGVGILGAPITLTYDGTLIGTATTGPGPSPPATYGYYSISATIDVAGAFTLTAKFLGMEVAGVTLRESTAYGYIVVPPEFIPSWWWIAAGAGALALVVVGGVVAYQEAERQKLTVLMMR